MKRLAAVAAVLALAACAPAESPPVEPISVPIGSQAGAKPDMCTQQYVPVCGADGKTYGNACSAAAAGVTVASQGECKAS